MYVSGVDRGTALEHLINAMGKNGFAIDVIQITHSNCIAIFVQEYAGRRYGIIRQLLFGNSDKNPIFTHKGLNATREEWIRVANVLRSAENTNLAELEFVELLRLPQEGDRNAIQVYSHKIGGETRIVIGKIFNYKKYTGKCGGASFNISELGMVVEDIDALIVELENADAKVPAVSLKKSTGTLEVEDDFSHLF